MRKSIKKTLVLILVLSCMIMVATPAAAFYCTSQIDYIAFGDSVAAGVLADSSQPGSTESSEFGYTDIIAKMIGYSKENVNFNEDFCTSGQTASGLLNEINGYDKDGNYNSNIRDKFISLMEDADVVTIDIGANDLLGPLYEYYKNLDKPINLNDPTLIPGGMAALNTIISNLNTTGRTVQTNLEKILQSMLTTNKRVKIYVMGFYNPLPYLKTLGKDLTVPVAYFNTFIMRAIANVAYRNWGACITYVPTMVPMAMSVANLAFPDIHPTVQGYEVIANQFWRFMKFAVR